MDWIFEKLSYISVMNFFWKVYIMPFHNLKWIQKKSGEHEIWELKKSFAYDRKRVLLFGFEHIEIMKRIKSGKVEESPKSILIVRLLIILYMCQNAIALKQIVYFKNKKKKKKMRLFFSPFARMIMRILKHKNKNKNTDKNVGNVWIPIYIFFWFMIHRSNSQ